MDLQRVGCFFTDNRRGFQMCTTDRPQVGVYLCLPENGKCDFNLSLGFPERFDYHVMRYEGVDLMRQFLSHNVHLLKDVDFVTRRGILTQIMNVKKGRTIRFVATKFEGVIYLTDTPSRHMEDAATLGEFQGRRLEQFLFSQSPFSAPCLDVDVSNASGFHVVYRAELGGHRFLYNAEIDGVDARNNRSDRLSDLHLVEVKTCSRGGRYFDRTKALLQSYLAGVETLVVAHKDKEGIVKRLDTTTGAVEMRPPLLDASIAFLQRVMERVQRTMSGINDPNCIILFSVSLDKIEDCKYKKFRSLLSSEYVQQVRSAKRRNY